MAQEWHLAVQGHNQKTKMNTLYNVRILEDAERAGIHDATKLLQEDLEDAPYSRLTEEYADFKALIKEITDSFAKRSQSPGDLKKVSKQLDNVLSALRAFDDRTKHNLSQRYGKESEKFLLFGTALSEEFDNNFAYRFSCQLRNYSQHTGSTITNIQAGGHINGTSYCNPTFDSRELLAKYKKWQSQVKKDLAAINGEFSAIAIVDSMVQSCTRAYCKLLLALEPDLKPAMETIRSFANEALKDSAEPDMLRKPIILGLTRKDDGNYDMATLNIIPVRVDLMANAESAYRQANGILGSQTT